MGSVIAHAPCRRLLSTVPVKYEQVCQMVLSRSLLKGKEEPACSPLCYHGWILGATVTLSPSDKNNETEPWDRGLGGGDHGATFPATEDKTGNYFTHKGDIKDLYCSTHCYTGYLFYETKFSPKASPSLCCSICSDTWLAGKEGAVLARPSMMETADVAMAHIALLFRTRSPQPVEHKQFYWTSAHDLEESRIRRKER